MRRRYAAGLAVLLCGALALPAAQARPDFSGHWTSAPEPAAAAGREGGGAPGARRGGARGGARSGDMGSGWGDPITVTQDARQLTVESAFFSRGDLQPPLRYTYALDGSPTTNRVTMGRGLQTERSQARWAGTRLVITTTYTFAHPDTGQPVEGTLTRSLVLASPASLVVEVTRAGVLGGPASTTRTVYRKVS